MDDELDGLLVEARPASVVTARSHEAMVDVLRAAEAEARRRPRRRRRRTFLGLAAGAVVLAMAGAGADAGGFLPQPHDGKSWDNDPWAVRLAIPLPDGTTCHADYTVVPVDEDPIAHDADEWRDVWKVATDYVKSVDPESLLSPAVLARYRADAIAAHKREEAIEPPDELAPPETETQMRVRAPAIELMRGVNTALRARGLATDMLQPITGDDCPEAQR
ncbi:hypothetical protein [Nocardioides sp. Iso805N]|uniref:hypothetical protein n=1 Tax=Nocardioides sp. Iso805N TaxID=1283287 RepID=UPI00037065AA|nr:hypothetical protein [Nocardioides sp. Iso805N]